MIEDNLSSNQLTAVLNYAPPKVDHKAIPAWNPYLKGLQTPFGNVNAPELARTKRPRPKAARIVSSHPWPQTGLSEIRWMNDGEAQALNRTVYDSVAD